MRRTLPFGVLALLACAVAHAQLYKWVGPDGKVTYSDTPPPTSTARVETKSFSGNSGVATAGLPYELAEAVKNQPVTLYTTADCGPCNDGRNLLSQRGVPFVEKTVSTREDAEQFKKLSAENQFPLLQVGRSKEQGFQSVAWNNALTAAGYPQTSQLPQNYRNPSPQALAGEPKAVASKPTPAKPKESADAATPGSSLPAAGNVPPGFRF